MKEAQKINCLLEIKIKLYLGKKYYENFL